MPNDNYRAFTAEVKGTVREIITPAQVSLPYHPSLNAPEPRSHQALALWDTGATNCAITKSLVDRVGLKPSGKAVVHGQGGQTEQNVYLINVYLPNDVVVSGIRATECAETAGNFDLIIGMNIISQGDFAHSGANGKSKFSFRMPAMKAPDFVEELNNLNRGNQPKLGRNQLVEITSPDGSETKNIKWKRAKKLVEEEGWRLI